MTPSMMPPQQVPPGKKSMSWVVVLLVVGGLAGVCCIGTLAAIAVPNFLRFNSRAKAAEAKSNLKAAYTAQRAYFVEKDTYSEVLEDLGFLPEQGNRYRYFLSRTGKALTPGKAGGKHTGVLVDYARHASMPSDAALRAALPSDLEAELGVSGTCPDGCKAVMAAVANIDNDATLDVWSISTEDRVIDGLTVPAGMPHQHVDDARQ